MSSLYKCPICGGPTNYSSINYQPQPCLHCNAMNCNPKPEYWERPEAVARFEADMEKAREVLEEAQETKPHQKWWEVLEETE